MVRSSSELGQRRFAAAAESARRRGHPLDLGAAELQLTGGELGERDGDDAVERGPAGGERRDDAADERRRLAGPGRGFDDQRRVEVGRDAIALRLIGERRVAHGMPRSRARAARRSCGLRFWRTSSYGPQTDR